MKQTASSRRTDSNAHGGSGFTLLEVLISIGLLLMLMSAVVSALGFYRRMSETGRIDVERAQITRAILDKMARDIRSVVFVPEETEDDETDDVRELTDDVVDADGAFIDGVIGITGDTSQLAMLISRPARDMNYGAIADRSGLQTSDLLMVSWFLAVRGAGDLAGAVAESAPETLTEQLMPARSEVRGLARMEGDALTLQMADQSADIDVLAAGASVLAPEISRLRFGYLFGGAVHDSWDSASANALPQAIEISFGFRPAARELASGRLQDDQTVGAIRHVITVPLSAPYNKALHY